MIGAVWWRLLLLVDAGYGSVASAGGRFCCATLVPVSGTILPFVGHGAFLIAGQVWSAHRNILPD